MATITREDIERLEGDVAARRAEARRTLQVTDRQAEVLLAEKQAYAEERRPLEDVLADFASIEAEMTAPAA